MGLGRWLFGVVALVVCLSASSDPPQGHEGATGVVPVFGATVVELSLTVENGARQSLIAAPMTDVPARLTFEDAAGIPRTGHVEIHIKGQLGSARPFEDKPAFKVVLGSLGAAFALDQLTLNNMVQDRTMLHEAIGYQVYAAAGVRVPATGYAHLTMNGRDYGLYLNLETPDRRFLERVFGDGSGILYEGAYGVDLRAPDADKFQLHEGTDAGRARLRQLIAALDGPADGIFYGPDARVDTDSFLGMMAAGVLLGDWDNYFSSNNYRIYWNPSTSRWHFIPTGLDQTFVRATGVFAGRGLLFQRCLSSPRCAKDYAMRVRDVAGRFSRLDLAARMDALLAVIGSASRADPKKPCDNAQMAAAREGMRAFIARRPREVLAALSSR